MNVHTIENTIIFLPQSFILQSPVLKMLQRLHKDNLFLCVNEKTLKQVLQYVNMFSDDNVPHWGGFVIPDSVQFLQELLTIKECEFVSTKTNDELLELLGFCDYIDFEPLRQLIAFRVAFEMKLQLHDRLLYAPLPPTLSTRSNRS